MTVNPLGIHVLDEHPNPYVRRAAAAGEKMNTAMVNDFPSDAVQAATVLHANLAMAQLYDIVNDQTEARRYHERAAQEIDPDAVG